jgi:TolB-like protein
MEPAAPVSSESSGPDQPPTGETQPVRKRKKDKVRSAWIAFVGRIVAQVVGAVASIALAIMFLQQSRTDYAPREEAATVPARPVVQRAPGEIGLAVLPLSNYSGDSQQDYFADGMTEALIADLAQLEGLHVISRTSAMQYRGAQKSLPQIAGELGVEMIVEGSVVRVGNRVRVTAQLIEAASDRHLWARSYERTTRDVLALQGQVAHEIARELKVVLTPHQQGRLTARTPVDPAVYDMYLCGRQAWSLRTDDGFDAAIASAASPSGADLLSVTGAAHFRGQRDSCPSAVATPAAGCSNCAVVCGCR